MRRQLISIAILATGLLLVGSCGGGGGGGGGGAVTTADLGGTWLGPSGNVNLAGGLGAPATTAGMDIDAAGNMTGTLGVFAGATGPIALVDAFARTFAWTGTGTAAGATGLIVLSRDRNHLLFLASDGTFAAFQKGAVALQPPYSDPEFRPSSWSGVAVEMDPAFAPQNPEPVDVTVDGAGNFTAGTSTSGAMPLTVFDPNTGELRGDFMDGLETGTLVLLATPDRQFVAIFSCLTGASDPVADCDCTALQRN